MPENIKCATTNNIGKVFLLTEANDWWTIKSADTNEQGAHWIYCAGDRNYVQSRWNNFVANEKNAVSANFQDLVNYNRLQDFRRF